MKYRRNEEVTSPSSLPFGGLFSFPFDLSQRPLTELFKILDAWQLLHANGCRVLPPKPPRAGKGGRPPVWQPEMKVALLGAVQNERAKWKTKRPSDRTVLERLQARGAYDRWKINTLITEVSRARAWFFRSEAGQRWYEENELEFLRLEKIAAEADKRVRARA